MARSYGPTYESETLWAIASRHLPNKNVSIFKVIGAIYNLNHDAFENNNIHSLLPGSYLKLPTMDQIEQQRISAVSRKLAADQLRAPYATELEKRRLAEQQATTAAAPIEAKKTSPQPAVTESSPATKNAPAADVAPTATSNTDATANIEPATPPTAVAAAVKKALSAEVVTDVVDGDNNTIIPAKPVQPQVDVTHVKMNALVESNHALRLRLSEMQQDMAALKNQVTESDSIRQQMVSFLEQQKQVAAPVPETWLERLTNNPWALAAAGIIPGGLIAALLALLLFRRKKK